MMMMMMMKGCRSNGEATPSTAEGGVILGLNGGTTSTVCVCIPASITTSLSSSTAQIPILSRSLAGCTNHNFVCGLHVVFGSGIGTEVRGAEEVQSLCQYIGQEDSNM